MPRRVPREKASPAQLRALRDSDDELGFDPSVWREMVEMGWAGIAIPRPTAGWAMATRGSASSSSRWVAT
jgi:alkylation response protein AidB-like acyl-CoA dehydrogenase